MPVMFQKWVLRNLGLRLSCRARSPSRIGSANRFRTTSLARASQGVAVDPNIRSTVNRDTRVIADNNTSFVDSLIFWQEKEPAGTIIDPKKEQQRLRDAEATGRSSGAPTPTIERRKRGLLEGIF